MLRIIEETSEGKGFALGSSLDDLARGSARRMLVSALDAEVTEYVERYRSGPCAGSAQMGRPVPQGDAGCWYGCGDRASG